MPHWLIGSTKQLIPQDPYFVDREAEEPAAPVEQPEAAPAALRNSVPQRFSSRTAGTRLPYRHSELPPSTNIPSVPQIPGKYRSPTASVIEDYMPSTPSAAAPYVPSPTPSEAATTITRADSPTHPGPPPAHGHVDSPSVPQDAFFDANVGVRPRLRRNYTPSSTMHRSELAATQTPQATIQPEAAAPQPTAPSPVASPSLPAPTAPTATAPQTTSTQLRFPPSLPPVLQQVLLPQPPIGPQCQLFGFNYRSEPVDGEEDSWMIEMSYKVRIAPESESNNQKP